MNETNESDDLFPHGLLRITAASPVVSVANPIACAEHCIDAIEAVGPSHIVLLPELALGGYTCGDLFGQDSLLSSVTEAIDRIRMHNRNRGQLVIVGAPIVVNDALMNVAVAIADGKVIAAVPKQYLPNYREFYEARHFVPGTRRSPYQVEIAGQTVDFGIDLILAWGDARIAIEICEDLWIPIPPSSLAAIMGANVLLNLSSSNETIAKAAWRRDLVTSQSGRCIAAYAYASSGPTESTTDIVFGGHCLIAENGRILAQSGRVGDTGDDQPLESIRFASADIDLQKIRHDRRIVNTWHQTPDHLRQDYRILKITTTPPFQIQSPIPAVDAAPFIPKGGEALKDRCAEILSIQSAGLAKRISRLPHHLPLVIGISGGLDSTLALLVAAHTMDVNGWPRNRILGMTMPGFGTTSPTQANAVQLMLAMKIKRETIDIRELSIKMFRSLSHSPLGVSITDQTDASSLQTMLVQADQTDGDLVLENVQARLRTLLLMSRGFVLGTGDMSEQALGWCTYNADHMSMYNVNTSIPKTLVRFLIRQAATTQFDDDIAGLLRRIADTAISPELLPPDVEGNIKQNTEDAVGPYELHDFFLYHLIRNGFDRRKILFLAKNATFSVDYSLEVIEQTLETFYRRFFANQFKRSCVPDGPKVGSVSLSPRGDWRMPSDADGRIF